MSLRALYPRLTDWLAVPYLAPGPGIPADTLAGWDCWGCIRHIGREQFGIQHGDFAGPLAEALAESGAAPGGDTVPNAVVARMIRDHMGLYRPVPPKAGAVALFRVGGDFLHVAQMLTPAVGIHAIQPLRDSPGGTFTLDITNGQWSRPHRFIGCFEPV